MKRFVVVLALASMVISCKDDKKVSTEETKAVEEVTVKENFSIEMDVQAAKKDDFAVYYTENGTNEFSETSVAWKGVKGGPDVEKLVIDLPADVAPTNVRLDFGLNKDQESVTVKNIKIIYYGKELSFKGSEFFNYFIKDDKFKTDIDAAAGTLKISKNGTAFATPYFYPRQELIDAIKKLTL